MSPSLQQSIYVRNFVFGGEDSLVSTVGLLSGVVAAGLARNEIITTGVILIFVEALSMAVGSYLSESSAEEYMAQSAVAERTPMIGGVVMFISYFVLGFVPLAPYLFLAPETALGVSIALSIIALAALGSVSARRAKVPAGPRARRMVILGGMAIVVGVVVGKLLPS